LDPTFNGIHLTQPLIKKIIKKKLSPLNLLEYQTQYLFEIEHLLKDLPQTMNRLVLRLEKGKINMETDLKGLDKFSDRLETMTNRISLAVLISSVIIGSSLILQTNKGMPMPTIGFSSVGLVIFLIGSIFALILTISIIRKGRL
jgi:ubiquinone biosynthesis protein